MRLNLLSFDLNEIMISIIIEIGGRFLMKRASGEESCKEIEKVLNWLGFNLYKIE